MSDTGVIVAVAPPAAKGSLRDAAFTAAFTQPGPVNVRCCPRCSCSPARSAYRRTGAKPGTRHHVRVVEHRLVVMRRLAPARCLLRGGSGTCSKSHSCCSRASRSYDAPHRNITGGSRLNGDRVPGVRVRAVDPFEPFLAYVTARLVQDPVSVGVDVVRRARGVGTPQRTTPCRSDLTQKSSNGPSPGRSIAYSNTPPPRRRPAKSKPGPPPTHPHRNLT